MALIGKIYQRREIELADVSVIDGPNYTEVSVTMGMVEVILFPLVKGLDPDAIASKISNVVNQCGLIDYPVRVELQ